MDHIEKFIWPVSAVRMPFGNSDTEQTEGLQSLTPDCIHDVSHAMFVATPRFVLVLVLPPD